MKDIFADLYKKVLNFFSRTEENGENAKDVACNRLKLVLMQDRTNLTPAIMDRMRKELIELLSKYMELDRELLDLNFEHEDEQMALMLSIPVIRAKDENEINAILEKEDEERKKLKSLLGEDAEEEDDDNDDDEDDNEDEDVAESDDNDESDGSDKSAVKTKKERKKEKFFKEKKNGEPVEEHVEPVNETEENEQNEVSTESESEPVQEEA